MKNKALVGMFLVLLLLLFQNCGKMVSADKLSPGSIMEGTSTGNPPTSSINFSLVSAKVFEPHCVSCHKSGSEIDYTNYKSTMSSGELSSLYLSYKAHREPDAKCSPIPVEDMNLVVSWIEAGTPQ